MECKDFWIRYEESGLDPELEAHLASCSACREEFEIETILNRNIAALPVHRAPKELWKKIQPEIADTTAARSEFLGNIRKVVFRPVFAAAAMIVIIIGISFLLADRSPFGSTDGFTVYSQESMLLREQEYAGEIAKYTEMVERDKDRIIPGYYRSSSEKIALLNDYLLQCKEALSINTLNPNAQKSLFRAYDEIVVTLKDLLNRKA